MAERTDDIMPGDDGLGGEATWRPADSETAEIRAEISETRERMGDTVEQIGERLNPSHLKEQVKQDVRDATIGKVEQMAQNAADRADQVRYTTMDTIRQNPIPATMVGVGLGWLVYNATQRRPRRVHERTTSRLTTSGLMEDVQGTAGQLADRAQQAAGSVAEETRHRARRLEDRFHENPLALGAAAVALGMTAGLAIPETRKESELMGGTRQRFMRKVGEVAEETKDKVEHVAERVVDQAQSTAKQAAREEGLTSS
jgi:ElaB/YqjD/DUF883 family membrane-anchored ribosome-binding protein